VPASNSLADRESSCTGPPACGSAVPGDCLAAKLPPGNVHGADGWEELLLPESERQAHGKEVTFRGPRVVEE
jgi:hypothetical protein